MKINPRKLLVFFVFITVMAVATAGLLALLRVHGFLSSLISLIAGIGWGFVGLRFSCPYSIDDKA